MSDKISEGPGVRIVAGPASGGAQPRRFWGMTGRQRLEQSRVRAGAQDTPSPGRGTVLIRDDFIFDEMLIPALLRQPGILLTSSEGEPVAAHLAESGPIQAVEDALATGDAKAFSEMQLRAVDSAGLASTYNKTLRRRSPPYLMRIDSMPAVAIERRMFNGAYKGVTDFVTKRVWPWPAFHATRFCARFGISPNMVTAVSLVLVLLAMWFFWGGQFAVGLACAWGMCFLDTVDGKLARVTLRSTPFGNIFDHGIDLIHPPFWYWAWYHGLRVSGLEGSTDATWLALMVILVGYVGGRLQEGLFTWLHGIEIHIWRPLDSWFREITARRNPNLFILTVAIILGAPREGFLAVAAWTIVSFVFHSIRILQASLAKAMGRAPASWLSEPIQP